MSEQELLLGLLAIAVILVVGRGSAEIARRFGQAEVLGELLGGFLIGPSVLGALLPSVYRTVFLSEGVAKALSLFSWMGAILVLLIAGLEVDPKLVRQLAKPGGYTAVFAIGASVAAGTVFGRSMLGATSLSAFFLGIVLSVTGVSVIAKILIERDSLRRAYAQVILAAGVASEVLVWPLISVVASSKSGNPFVAGIQSIGFVVLFFLFMRFVGRRFTFWAMRRTADLTQVVAGQLSLVLILVFASAGITLSLGLHPLLGAFTFGLLLSQAPRTTMPLKENIQALAVGLFAPIFFVLAGMRVDISKLRSPSSIGILLALFAVSTLSKSGFSAIGARLGRLGWWESLLVGVGVNLKGGTDVIVAILGVELGLLSTETYTMYAVVAILTVLISPTLVAVLEKKVMPSQHEMQRLNREEARRRAYLPDIERVLVPMSPELFPAIAAAVVETIAQAKQIEGEIFDITQLTATEAGITESVQPAATVQAEESLDQAGELEHIELTKELVTKSDSLGAILESGKKHNLIAIAANPPTQSAVLSFGELQDQIISQAESDVLIVVRDPQASSPIDRILVPVNGHEHSMSAADLAAYLARAHNAELVLFTVVHSKLDSVFWRERKHRDLLASGYRLLREVAFRIERLGVKAIERVQLGEDAAEEILKETSRSPYQLMVLGTVDRSTQEGLQLGRSIQALLTRSEVPAVVLVTHPITRQS